MYDRLAKAVDKILTMLTSRKCWAFAVTTYLLYLGVVSSEVYAVVALAFMGTQGLLDYKQMGQSLLHRSQSTLPQSSPVPTYQGRAPDTSAEDIP